MSRGPELLEWVTRAAPTETDAEVARRIEHVIRLTPHYDRHTISVGDLLALCRYHNIHLLRGDRLTIGVGARDVELVCLGFLGKGGGT